MNEIVQYLIVPASFTAIILFGVYGVAHIIVSALAKKNARTYFKQAWEEWLEANPDCAKAIKEYNINIII